MRCQRGFTLVEMMVALAIVSGIVLATAGSFGARPPRAHAAQLVMQAALAEARGLARTVGDANDPNVPTGATVLVERDAANASHVGSVIRVFRSRPVPTLALGATSGFRDPAPLIADVGFPAERVAATFELAQGDMRSEPPFAILISHAGYVSILAGFAYDPRTNRFYHGSDPGCLDGRVTIAADDGLHRSDPAAFSCRDATLQLPETPDAR